MPFIVQESLLSYSKAYSRVVGGEGAGDLRSGGEFARSRPPQHPPTQQISSERRVSIHESVFFWPSIFLPRQRRCGVCLIRLMALRERDGKRWCLDPHHDGWGRDNGYRVGIMRTEQEAFETTTCAMRWDLANFTA
jgi:hypothetical protein